MKRSLLPALFLVAAAVPCAHLQAQQIVPFIGGGVALGMGEVGNDSNAGWLILGGFDVPLPTLAPQLSFGVSGSYASIPYQGGFSEATQITGIFGELSYLLSDAANMLRPYIRGGGGIQIHRYDPGSTSYNAITDTRAAFTAGAGVKIMMGEADAMLGARFASGTDGGFVGVHAGVALPVGP